jgi:hypothetical protein
MKTQHNSHISGAHNNLHNIKVVGNGEMFQLLCNASSQSEGWMKSTKACQVVGGCIVQVTTHQRNHDGTNSIAEALTYVPGVRIDDDVNGGRKLVPSLPIVPIEELTGSGSRVDLIRAPELDGNEEGPMETMIGKPVEGPSPIEWDESDFDDDRLGEFKPYVSNMIYGACPNNKPKKED